MLTFITIYRNSLQKAKWGQPLAVCSFWVVCLLVLGFCGVFCSQSHFPLCREFQKQVWILCYPSQWCSSFSSITQFYLRIPKQSSGWASYRAKTVVPPEGGKLLRKLRIDSSWLIPSKTISQLVTEVTAPSRNNQDLIADGVTTHPILLQNPLWSLCRQHVKNTFLKGDFFKYQFHVFVVSKELGFSQ